jgi:hypothetical protein
MALSPQLVPMLGFAPVITNCCSIPDKPSMHVALPIHVYAISHTGCVRPCGGLLEADEVGGVGTPSVCKPMSDYVSRFGGWVR